MEFSQIYTIDNKNEYPKRSVHKVDDLFVLFSFLDEAKPINNLPAYATECTLFG